jgi:hypothetical protein
VEKRVAFQHEWESEAGSLQSGQSDAAGKHGSYGAELSPEDEKRNGEAAKGDVPQQSPTGVVLVGHSCVLCFYLNGGMAAVESQLIAASMGGLLVADAATKWLRPEAGMPAENGTLLRIRSVIGMPSRAMSCALQISLRCKCIADMYSPGYTCRSWSSSGTASIVPELTGYSSLASTQYVQVFLYNT